MDIQTNVSLSQHTTLKVGGLADYFVVAQKEEDVLQALDFATEKTLPVLVLGGGSNVLMPDTGYRGIVIKNELLGETVTEEGDEVRLTVGAGETLDDVIARAVERGYWGLENLSSIPGTIGATPVQNVGAYGVEVSVLIANVTAVHKKNKNKKVFSNQDCQFSYRDSFFKTPEGREWIITSVTFVLTKKSRPVLEYGELKKIQTSSGITPQTVRAEVQRIRAQKFPDWSQVGTAGSFFKNPIIAAATFEALQSKYPAIPGYIQDDGNIKVSLGWVLDHVCGLKGFCQERVCLYENQALVLVTKNNATAEDIKQFVSFVKNEVKEKTGITIEEEVKIF